jgi:hypothetical protein
MAAISTASLGVAVSSFQMVKGIQDAKKAKQEMNEYERQTLTNAFENSRISTVGSELMREESQRTTADLIQASRNSGVRGIMGAIPKIQAKNTMDNRDDMKYLDDQVLDREENIANDNINIRNINENRDNQNIAAISSQIDAGNQDTWSGITGISNSLGKIGSAIDDDLENLPPEERAAKKAARKADNAAKKAAKNAAK